MRSVAVRTLLACAATAAVGAGALAAATDGFSAFTYDGARAQRALRAPYALPVDLALVTHEGRAMRLADLDAPVLLLNFVFTRCVGVCRSAGDLYGRLGQALAAEIERGQLRLLTVSIDPARDTPPELARWRARHAPSGAHGWIVGAPPDRRELARWQDAFGIVVLPLPNGDFEHNAAIAVIGPERRIHAFVAPERADELPQWVRRVAQAVGASDA